MAPSPPVIVTTDLDGPAPPAEPQHATPLTPSRHRRDISDPSHLSPATAQGYHAPANTNTYTPASPTSTVPSVTEGTLAPEGHNKEWSSATDSAIHREVSPTVTAVPNEEKAEVDEKKKKFWQRNKEEPEEGKAGPNVSHLDPDKDTTDPTPFKENPSRLAMLVDPKSLNDLEKIGGIRGLLDGLGVEGSKGLNATVSDGSAPRSAADAPGGGGPQWHASIDEHRRVYGANDLPVRKSKSLLELMWMAFKDKVLILLSIAAVVSLALGLYSDFGRPDTYTHGDGCPPEGCKDAKVDWVEGVAIMVAIIIVVLVGSVNDWQKERQFKKLSDKRDDRTVKVIRNGNEQVINVRDLVVGDIALVEPGEVIPVDGVFIRGHNVRCDESGATGESDAIKKTTYDECIAERDNLKPGGRQKLDCFMVSGAKVLEGVGEYVVIAVGTHSFNGRIMMAMRTEAEETPLQLKLNKLAELIATCGGVSGLVLFVALMIRFFVKLKTHPNRSANEKADGFIQNLIISVTLIVVAVPEGLPLAVTLALAFATKRMTKQNLLVRVLGSCETMGHATVICTDKTGTLTQNVMSVVAGSLGVHGKFVANITENKERSIADVDGAARDDFAFDMAEMNDVAGPDMVQLFNEAICINSTAFEDKNQDGELEFVGSKTETALLRFAKELGWQDYKKTREAYQVVQMIPFSSELKAMGVVVKRGDVYRLYLKGASEILTGKCARFIDTPRPAQQGIHTQEFDDLTVQNINKTIIFYADQTLRTLALCYRDFPAWPPPGAESSGPEDVPFQLLASDMTLIAITGIEDPLRPGVTQAVAECQGAGVSVKMCTGDNVLTARSIAKQCGIFTPGGIVMEGPVFRKLTDADRYEIVPRLQILARSSPEDKKLLVKTLKSQGEVVGVTGDGTNDGPALKLANVGFAMGIAGTEVAKEASDIILMDDSFSNIVLAVMWGRCVNDSVKKFLQFQISVNITAVVITFISAVSSEEEKSVLTAVQLLWVNLIMDTFAALALATDPATRASLQRKPDRKNAPLITVDMFKMIVIQAIYQIIVCLVLHFKGMSFLNMQWSDHNELELRSLVFNCFVFCQIFNQLNCRRLDRKFNVLEGFFRNYYFMVIFAIMVGGQILILEVGGAAFQVTRINGRDWGISLIVGFLSIPLGAVVRMIPTRPIERFLIWIGLYADPAKLPLVAPDDEDEEKQHGFEYNPALEKVKDNLGIYASLRGGRLRASSLVGRSRHAKLREHDIQLPSLLAMVPTLVAGGVGAGGNWVTQVNQHGLANPAAQDPSRSTTDLYAGKVQMHPDTDPNDPMYAKFGITPPSPAKQSINPPTTP